MSLKVYIGFDRREQAAYSVAESTARAFGCEVIPLHEDRLRSSGLLTRPIDRRSPDGRPFIWDFNSDAGQATDFAIARFFVPLLAHSGWCLFVDCDVVFMEDPHELLKFADEAKAVLVVQHPQFTLSSVKMDGQAQSAYPRKLWSSVVLWNASHEANKRLNLTTLNQWPGRDLHAFKWLNDSEIGKLPAEANWLVGLQPKPARPLVAHFTLGTPNIPGRESSEHAEIWNEKARA